MKRRSAGFAVLLSGLMVCIPILAQGAGATYYVSKAGSDGNDGLTAEKAFATIGKAASLMVAGDKCIIRQGIYRETVKPTGTGSSIAPMTFEAFPNDLVYISGADPITGWTQHSGSIYKAQMTWSLGRYKNQLVVDGKMAWVARSPDVDDNYDPNPYHMWCSGSFGLTDRRKWQAIAEPIAIPQRVCMGGVSTTGYGQVGSSFNYNITLDGTAAYKQPPELFNHPNDFFKDGLLTVHNIYWLGTGLISSSTSSATHTVFNAGRINPMSQQGGAAGYVSYVFALLDAPNEWYFDSTTQTVYLWAPDGQNPATHLVEAKKRVLGFDLKKKQYVNVRNLRFICASMTLDSAENCRIEGCQFKYVAHNDVPSKDEMGTYYGIKQDCSPGQLGIYIGGKNNVMTKCLVRGSSASGIVVSGRYDTVTNCIVTGCNYSPTYHAGILVMPPKGDFNPTNMPEGIDINYCYFAFNCRASIQVGGHANGPDPKIRIKIHNNNFAQSNYATGESGQLAVQSCKQGEAFNNVHHDVAWIQSASICTESDFGGRGWKVHHSVFYQGDSTVIWREIAKPTMLRCCDWTFTYGDADAMCFNNTIIDSTEYGHKDWETMASFQGVPWPGVVNKNNLWAKCDTAPWHFTNPRKRDYTLRSDSKAIDAGEVIPGWVEKFNGKAPDLGAFEYGDTPWVAGATWQEQAWVYPPPDIVGIRSGFLASMHAGRLSMRVLPGRLIIDTRESAPLAAWIFDARGLCIASRVQPAGGVAVVSTRLLSAGVYTVRIVSGGKSMVCKAFVR